MTDAIRQTVRDSHPFCCRVVQALRGVQDSEGVVSPVLGSQLCEIVRHVRVEKLVRRFESSVDLYLARKMLPVGRLFAVRTQHRPGVC